MAEAFPSEFLAASPVMLLVFFHQAFRGELSELHLLAADLVEGGRPELVAVIRDRFEFLKLAYSYHSAAEDEVRSSVSCLLRFEHEDWIKISIYLFTITNLQ